MNETKHTPEEKREAIITFCKSIGLDDETVMEIVDMPRNPFLMVMIAQLRKLKAEEVQLRSLQNQVCTLVEGVNNNVEIGDMAIYLCKEAKER